MYQLENEVRQRILSRGTVTVLGSLRGLHLWPNLLLVYKMTSNKTWSKLFNGHEKMKAFNFELNGTLHATAGL